MSRLQLKLAAVLSALVVSVVLLSGAFAERALRSRELDRLEQRLSEQAELVQELVAGVPFEADSIERLEKLADRAGAAAGVRVTLIAADGTVVGDSEVPTAALRGLESHALRPEVRAALEGRRGRDARRSNTVHRDLFYLAVPRSDPGMPGLVRLSVDLDDVDAAAAELRGELLKAGALALVAAVVFSSLLAWLTLRPVEELREVVRAIAAGNLERRFRWRSRDEVGEIASAINRMAEQLRQRLDQATAEKEQLEAVLTGMVEGVLVLDAKGHILLANPRLREVLSVWGEVVGRRPIEVIRNAEIDSALAEAAAGNEPVVREVAMPGPDHRALLLHAVRFPPYGARSGTVAVFHDVTEIRRLEQVRRDFISNASHELRTPLTSIRGYADTLLSGAVSTDQSKAYLQTILRNAERLGLLIDDLLELSRIESRRVPLRPVEVDVVRIARVLIQDLAPRLRDAALEATVEDRGAARAWADQRAAEQVLSNLLDNAVKYTEPGGHIRVRAWNEGNTVRVAVEDDGIGIPPRDQSRIFERFYRVDKTRSRALGGTGLGLSIVKHLVQAMGGDIRVESELGKGSCFTFWLPRVDAS